jgi:hypothetical protein
MLKVEVKGTGNRKQYVFDEDVILNADCELVGEDGDQSGRLVARSGTVLSAPDAEHYGLTALLDAATKDSNLKIKVAAQAKPVPKPRKRGRRKKAE